MYVKGVNKDKKFRYSRIFNNNFVTSAKYCSMLVDFNDIIAEIAGNDSPDQR